MDIARPLLPVEQWAQVTVVGLGLIGGSFARALRARWPALRLVGVDRREALAAVPTGLVDQVCGADDRAAVTAAFGGSELVFLAAPVSAIEQWLGDALDRAPLVSDCGSTKRSIVRAAADHASASRFVPGHPMAGSSGGLREASADLFQGRPWVLCPEGVDPAALAGFEALVCALGARPIRLSAVEHDRAVAVTSHAARLAASALLVVADRADAFAAAGPAFDRVRRGAGGEAGVWHDILASNADEVARALRELTALLEAAAAELADAGSPELALELLAGAERAAARYRSEHGRSEQRSSEHGDPEASAGTP